MSSIATLPFPAPSAAGIARLAMAGVVAGLGLAAAPQAAEARSFLDGQSAGMQKCVRAILGGYEVKRVNVHGHHFNCKPLYMGGTNRRGSYRAVRLSHSQRGVDDQIQVRFFVDSLNVLRPNSVNWRIDKGVSIRSLIAEFEGPANPPPVIDYAFYAERARAIRPVRVDSWKHAAGQIATIVIAELGNPDRRGTAPRQVDCELPTFWEHDNFRGRSYRLGGSQPDFGRVIVGGKPFDDVISSMCVPRGWTVTAYSQAGYRGFSYTFGGPREYEDLKRQPAGEGGRLNWGDLITSVHVSKR